MTSAPKSASSVPTYGPAMSWPNSTTRRPVSGPSESEGVSVTPDSYPGGSAVQPAGIAAFDGAAVTSGGGAGGGGGGGGGDGARGGPAGGRAAGGGEPAPPPAPRLLDAGRHPWVGRVEAE